MRNAPGGKLSEAEYYAIVDADTHYNTVPAHTAVCLRQVQRIVKGEAWKNGWVPRRAEDDVKMCAICGKEFRRRFANGRIRSDRLWNQKRTCGHHCAVKLMWREGAFKNRGKK